jgi:hypothetical protein
MVEIALGSDLKKIREDWYKDDGVRGKKVCPTCAIRIAAACKKCECGHDFYNRKKKSKSKKYREIDWSNLNRYDRIFVENADVWINHTDGSSIPMGFPAQEYTVMKVTREGLVLYSPRGGWCFQNMINTGYNTKTGITRNIPLIYKK